jgi:hypothetical protein
MKNVTSKSAPNGLSKNLQIAEKCLKGIVQGYQTGVVTFGEQRFQSIILQWGKYPVFIVDRDSYISVTVQAMFDPSVSEALKKLPQELLEAYKISFLQEIMSNHRTGVSYIPTEFKTMVELQGFNLTQNIHLSGSAESCTRLTDAIQEIISVAVRTMTVISSGLGSLTSSGEPMKPPPETMYR